MNDVLFLIILMNAYALLVIGWEKVYEEESKDSGAVFIACMFCGFLIFPIIIGSLFGRYFKNKKGGIKDD